MNVDDRLMSVDPTDRRAVSPVVEKSLVTTIALLYVSGMMGLLMGGFIPGYQTAAADELGERTLSTAAASIEGAATTVDGDVERTETVDLPSTIRNEDYRLILEDEAAEGATLRLVHSHDDIGATVHLGLPANVTGVESEWQSGGGKLVIRVSGPAADRTVELGEPS